MGTFIQDIRYAGRLLIKNPGFAIIVVLTLAIGIGANTTLFSVVKAVLLEPLPYDEPQRLVTLWSQEDWPYGTNIAEYLDIRERQQALEDIAVYAVRGQNLTGQGVPVRVNAALVTGGFFSILGVEPVMGRTFTDEDDRPEAELVAVLRHGFWQRQFGGDPALIGKSIALDGSSATVIGVMPADFDFPNETANAWFPGEKVDVWVPARINPASPGGRGGHGLPTVARLRDGVSLQQASDDIRRISTAMHQENPDSYPEQFRGGWTLRLEPLHTSMVGDVRPALLMLLGATGFVLLIVCGNVINLLLMRGTAHAREIAVRLALGASRARIVRQLLTESTLLALLGGVAGLALAFWGLELLVRLAPQSIPRLHTIGIDTGILATVFLLSTLTGILSGLVPALAATRTDLHSSLKEGAKGTAGGRERGRSALVVIEVGLTVVLLVGAGMMLRTFSNLMNVDTGFRGDSVLTFRTTLPRATYDSPASRAAFYEQLIEKVGALPGVEAAGAISALPLGQDDSSAVMAEGMPPNQPRFSHGLVGLTSPRVVSPGYFDAMGITLVAGRFFNATDTGSTAEVAIVSDQFAAEAWGDEPNIVGKRVAFPSRQEIQWRTVIGVIRDVREEAGNLASERYKDAYFPLTQVPQREMTLTLKTSVTPVSLIGQVRQELATLDAELPLYDARSMEDVISQAVALPRFNAMLLGSFAIIALVLAVIGIYGVVSFAVKRRTGEIGIRVALGAQQGNILRLVLGRGMVLVIIGVALGLGGGLFLTRLLQSLLFQVTPTDWQVFATVAALLAAVGLLAAYIPARRAARVNPVLALRDE